MRKLEQSHLDRIKSDYQSSNMSVIDIASKHNVHRCTVSRLATEFGWLRLEPTRMIQARHAYEHSTKPIKVICIDFAISASTLRRWVRRFNWAPRPKAVRGMCPKCGNPRESKDGYCRKCRKAYDQSRKAS